MSLIKTTKLQKRNKRPKQIRNWIFRLSAKSSGKLNSKLYPGLFVHRRYIKTYFYFPYKDIFVEMWCYQSGDIEIEFFELDTIDNAVLYKIFQSFLFRRVQTRVGKESRTYVLGEIVKLQRTNFLPKQFKHWCRKMGIINIYPNNGRCSRYSHTIYKEYIVTFCSKNNKVEVVFYDVDLVYYEAQLTHVIKNFNEFRRFIETCENHIRFVNL